MRRRSIEGFKKHGLSILPLVAFALLFFPKEVFAWGVGFHMMHGSFILQNIQWLSGPMVEILRAFPRDYLYGCVSADIFIGKGSKYHADHCHNWSVARKLLHQAKEPPLLAFAYGYLSHLAADIVAHNVYVPNQLYLTSSTTRWGHIYWELRADEYTDPRHWKEVLEIISTSNDHNDFFVQEIVKKNLISFEMKKKLFTHAVKLYDLGKRQRAVSIVSRNSRWDVTQGYVESLHRKCLNLIVDFLNNPERAICYQYDPIGSRRLAEAKKLRRFSKRIHGKDPTEYIFETPVEIEGLACCHFQSEESLSFETNNGAPCNGHDHDN